MPFKSEAQRKWMHANKPEMAKKWEKHTPKDKKLPKKKSKSESLESRLDAVLEGRRPISSPLSDSGFDYQLDFVLAEIGGGDSNGS